MNEMVSAPLEAQAASGQAPSSGKIGVLLVNLGTPDAADPASVRRYLKEFLTDPRVIEAYLGKGAQDEIAAQALAREAAHG